MACLALILTCLVLAIALSSSSRSMYIYLITLIVSETHFKKFGLLAPSRRQGNIQLNLVHPPRRHPAVPENKVSGNKLSIGHLVAKRPVDWSLFCPKGCSIGLPVTKHINTSNRMSLPATKCQNQ